MQKKFGAAANGILNITLSRQDFASYIGATYETVFRVMNEMAEEKVIRMEGKDIFILSESTLTDYIKD